MEMKARSIPMRLCAEDSFVKGKKTAGLYSHDVSFYTR